MRDLYASRPILVFPSEDAAERALAWSGFAVGIKQGKSPRGVMHGSEYLIMKWRDLTRADLAALHGIYFQTHRDGPVTITLSHLCPRDAADDLRAREFAAHILAKAGTS
ncbi:hypothetical protein [Pararhodobacter marinus]|uniref:hypothetical protein n=1 Tax=Pararhodobacter marinus TaxID=2184063 RepID=UPI0035199003